VVMVLMLGDRSLLMVVVMKLIYDLLIKVVLLEVVLVEGGVVAGRQYAS
jgi:hypothetical protein